MSKRNKNRYQNKQTTQVESTPVTAVASPVAPSRPAVDGVYALHEKEYRLVRTDLLRVLVVNVLFLAGMLAIYFINRSNPFLQAWYDKLF